MLANSALLVLVGLAHHRATRRVPVAAAPAAAAPRDDSQDEVDADLDAVIARYNQVLDISREDLKALLEDTQLRGYQRKLANIRCGDIMSRQLITVHAATPMPAGWALFREHRIKALPVIDSLGAIVGIVTPADFVRENAAQPAAQAAGRIGQIMTRKVRVACVARHLVDLIPLFAGSGHHHLPIVEADGRLVGIVTQSDVVAALCRVGAAASPPAPKGA